MRSTPEEVVDLAVYMAADAAEADVQDDYESEVRYAVHMVLTTIQEAQRLATS